jgi:hypothetical protein
MVLTALLRFALVAAALAVAPAFAQAPFVKNRLVQVDVYDRRDGTALPVYAKDGRHYIVGVPGHEYAVRIRNCTAGRILVVTSVDGVNVISGDTAAPSQPGYVLEPWGSVEIAGWRKSLARTAAFYFTDLGDSYAARTGRPQNVGVIGVAVFEEKTRARITQRDQPWRPFAESEAQPPAAPSAAQSGAAASADSRAEHPREQLAERKAEQAMNKLGTGHGRSEESRVTVTQFERATSHPAETVAIQYDRRDNLLAMGVIPQFTPHIARRDPNPFPGMRFVPNP